MTCRKLNSDMYGGYKREDAPKFHIFMELIVELDDIALHNFVGLLCFFHKPEKFRDKIRAKDLLR